MSTLDPPPWEPRPVQHEVTCRVLTAILLCVVLPCSAGAWQPSGPVTYDDKNAAHWVSELSSSNARARWLAAYALGRIAPQDAAAVAALTQRIDDDDLKVCRYSIHALGRIGPAAKSAVPELIKVIELAGNVCDCRARKRTTSLSEGPSRPTGRCSERRPSTSRAFAASSNTRTA